MNQHKVSDANSGGDAKRTVETAGSSASMGESQPQLGLTSFHVLIDVPQDLEKYLLGGGN